MQTKKNLSTGTLLVIALFSVNSVMAQTTPAAAGAVEYDGIRVSSDKVTVSLNFQPIQSIQINPDQDAVNFVYDSPEDYATGAIENKTQTLADHLTVYHSGPFKVQVTSTGFKKDGLGDAILEDLEDHVEVTASKGTTTKERNNLTFTTQSLSAGTKEFFSSTGGGMGLTFDVTYDHTGWKSEDTYIDFTNGTATSIYTADVTYTIVTQ
ncbi:MAG: hypothetical protein PHV53_09860 [Fermentimonas sp.]|nr:hypothetical protein [Fermentimonas sp.]